MTLRDLMDNWEDISYKKKLNTLAKIGLVLELRDDSPLLWELLDISANAEDEDYFGTEGLRID